MSLRSLYDTSKERKVPRLLGGPHLIRPSTSHFRRVTLTFLETNSPASDSTHIYIPQWRFLADYERLYHSGHPLLPSTPCIAFTLPHLLSIVREKTGKKFTEVYTDTGKIIRSLGEIETFSGLKVGMERENRPLIEVKLPILTVNRAKIGNFTSRNRIFTEQKYAKMPLSTRYSGELPNFSKSKLVIRKPPELDEVKIDIFTAKEVETLQKDYLRVKNHLISDNFPENSSEFGPNLKFWSVFALYLQEKLPELRNKPKSLFKNMLKSAGSDGKGVNWSQWMLLNAVFVYRNAPESIEKSYLARLNSPFLVSVVARYGRNVSLA